MLSINNQTNNIHSYKGQQNCVLQQKNEKLNKTIFLASIIASSSLKQYGTNYLKEVSLSQKVLAAIYPIMLGLIVPNNINLDESEITWGKKNDKKVKIICW